MSQVDCGCSPGTCQRELWEMKPKLWEAEVRSAQPSYPTSGAVQTNNTADFRSAFGTRLRISFRLPCLTACHWSSGSTKRKRCVQKKKKILPKRRGRAGRGPSLQLCAYTQVQSRAQVDVDCRSVPLSRAHESYVQHPRKCLQELGRGNDARAAVWVEKRPKETKMPSTYIYPTSWLDFFQLFYFPHSFANFTEEGNCDRHAWFPRILASLLRCRRRFLGRGQLEVQLVSQATNEAGCIGNAERMPSVSSCVIQTGRAND